MSDAHLLEHARQAFDRRAWADACRLFEAADRETSLEPEDLDRVKPGKVRQMLENFKGISAVLR